MEVTKKQEVHIEEPAIKDKFKEKTTIVKEGVIYPDGTVHTRNTRTETDIERKSGELSTGEKITEKIKDAGHAISETFSDGAKKIGLKKD